MSVDARPLNELVREHHQIARGQGVVLDLQQVQQLALEALRYYAAYGKLQSYGAGRGLLDREPSTFSQTGPTSQICHTGKNQSGKTVIGSEASVTLGEWGIIKPLFVLYVERENAVHLEASRSFGVDVYGRSVSEVTQDITNMEAEVMSRAFMRPIVTV